MGVRRRRLPGSRGPPATLPIRVLLADSPEMPPAVRRLRGPDRPPRRGSRGVPAGRGAPRGKRGSLPPRSDRPGRAGRPTLRLPCSPGAFEAGFYESHALAYIIHRSFSFLRLVLDHDVLFQHVPPRILCAFEQLHQPPDVHLALAQRPERPAPGALFGDLDRIAAADHEVPGV